MQFQNLRDRTFTFALRTVEFCRRLPGTWEARRIAGQLFDAGTSVGANYRASGRARSDSEFIAKIGTVVEEADEAEYWLQLLAHSSIDRSAERDTLAKEAAELRAIFVTSRKTAIRNRAKRRQQQSVERTTGNRG
jgi:four helix bundle protein